MRNRLISEIPMDAKGIYSLLIKIPNDIVVRIGKLGLFSFQSGIYVYIGSAMGKGSSSLRGRLLRHLGFRHNLHWHIDWLLSHSGVKVEAIVFAYTNDNYECKLVNVMEVRKVFVRGPKSFGSSDCKCYTHLFRLTIKNLEVAIAEVMKAFRVLSLVPHPIILNDLIMSLDMSNGRFISK